MKLKHSYLRLYRTISSRLITYMSLKDKNKMNILIDIGGYQQDLRVRKSFLNSTKKPLAIK